MNKVKVSKSELLSFLNLVTLKSNAQNLEAVLDTTNNIKALIRISGGNAIRGILKTNGSMGEPKLGILDMPLLISFVNSFNTETIEIKKDQNKLKLSSPTSKVKMAYVLGNPDEIKNLLEESKFEAALQKKNTEFKLTSTQVKEIVKHFDVISPNEVFLSTSGKSLSINIINKTENEITNSIDLETDLGNLNLKFNPMLIDILQSINNDIVMSLTDIYAYIRVEGKEYKIEYIISVLN